MTPGGKYREQGQYPFKILHSIKLFRVMLKPFNN